MTALNLPFSWPFWGLLGLSLPARQLYLRLLDHYSFTFLCPSIKLNTKQCEAMMNWSFFVKHSNSPKKFTEREDLQQLIFWGLLLPQECMLAHVILLMPS